MNKIQIVAPPKYFSTSIESILSKNYIRKHQNASDFLYIKKDKTVLNQKVGNTPQNAPIEAPNAISCALPRA